MSFFAAVRIRSQLFGRGGAPESATNRKSIQIMIISRDYDDLCDFRSSTNGPRRGAGSRSVVHSEEKGRLTRRNLSLDRRRTPRRLFITAPSLPRRRTFATLPLPLRYLAALSPPRPRAELFAFPVLARGRFESPCPGYASASRAPARSCGAVRFSAVDLCSIRAGRPLRTVGG